MNLGIYTLQLQWYNSCLEYQHYQCPEGEAGQWNTVLLQRESIISFVMTQMCSDCGRVRGQGWSQGGADTPLNWWKTKVLTTTSLNNLITHVYHAVSRQEDTFHLKGLWAQSKYYKRGKWRPLMLHLEHVLKGHAVCVCSQDLPIVPIKKQS